MNNNRPPYRSSIEMERTQPLPLPFRHRTTLRQLRQKYQLSWSDIAQATGLRVHLVYWMEIGIAVTLPDILKVLRVFSQFARYQYRLADIQGLRLKDPIDVYVDLP